MFGWSPRPHKLRSHVKVPGQGHTFYSGLVWAVLTELCWKATASSSYPNSWSPAGVDSCFSRVETPSKPEELLSLVIQLPAEAERLGSTPGFPSHQLGQGLRAPLRACVMLLSLQVIWKGGCFCFGFVEFVFQFMMLFGAFIVYYSTEPEYAKCKDNNNSNKTNIYWAFTKYDTWCLDVYVPLLLYFSQYPHEAGTNIMTPHFTDK